MMDLLRQDTRNSTPSRLLPHSGVGLEPWCPCGLIHSAVLLFFPMDDPMMVLTWRWKPRAPEPLPGTSLVSLRSISQDRFNQPV